MFLNNHTVTPPPQAPSLQKSGQTTVSSSHKSRKIYSALYHDSAHLHEFGDVDVVHHPAELLTDNAILILHGGADISPSIYHHVPSKRTGAEEKLSSRDLSEVLLAQRAIELGIPIFGICRGAQLVCALAGGSLIQHVDNHIGGEHLVVNTKGTIFSTTTCHHQMMNPWEVDHELIAWAAPARSNRYIVEHEKEIEMPVEPEVVFFPKIKALGVQGHPEWMRNSAPFVQYCLQLVKERLI